MTLDMNSVATDAEVAEDYAAATGLKAEVDEIVLSEGEEAAARLLRAFKTWEGLIEYKTKESKRLNEKLAGRIAQFKEAMEVGHSSTSDQVLKLSVVEQRWQEMEDAREERKLVGAACREQIKAAHQKIKDMIAEAKSSQLPLFQAEAEPASADEVDD